MTKPQILGALMLATPFVVIAATMWRIDGPPSRDFWLAMLAVAVVAGWVGIAANLLAG